MAHPLNTEPLTIHIIDLSGVAIADPLLNETTGIRYRTQYPGGIYGPASFVIPRDIRRRPTQIRAGYTVRFMDGFRVVWEGIIDGFEYVGRTQTRVECVGFWAAYCERRGIDRRWADNRLTDPPWKVVTTNNGAELATVDRNDRLRINTKSDQWNANDVFGVAYTMPTGETIKKAVMTVDFAEQAQNWTFRLRDTVGSTNIWSYSTAVSSGAKSSTLATGRQTLELQLLSGSTQTPTASDLYYGQVRSLTMYSERSSTRATLGNVNAYEIALDVAQELTGYVSANVAYISSSLTLAINPFYTDGRESFASILARAAAIGDASQNSLGYGLQRSQLASDGKPPLFLETFPALTSWDYELSLDDGEVDVREADDEIANWINVWYQDAAGRRTMMTPDDQSALKDTTSISQYGQREKTINASRIGSQGALDFGKRYLERYSNPTWAISRPVVVQKIRAAGGGFVPASMIEAGKRVRIVDLPDHPGAAGALGATFVITATDYNDEGKTASLALGGAPDDLGVLLAQLNLGVPQAPLSFVNYVFGNP